MSSRPAPYRAPSASRAFRRARTEPPQSNYHLTQHPGYTLKAFREIKNNAGRVVCNFSLYRPDEQATWDNNPKPIVDGSNEYILYLVENCISKYQTITYRIGENIKACFDNNVFCYGSTVDLVTGIYSGYWAQLRNFEIRGPTNSQVPHFDVILEYHIADYPNDRAIPIGYLCIPPYHLSTSPLYLEKLRIPRLFFRTHRLHKKLEPATPGPAPGTHIIDVDEESEVIQPASPDPLPFPAPISEDGHPNGSDL